MSRERMRRGLGTVLWAALAVVLCAGCGRTKPARPVVRDDAYYDRMLISGHAAFERDDIERAADLFENAWVRAQVMDRPAALGVSGFNLALVHILRGEYEAGQALLQQARTELERAGENAAHTWVAEAEVLQRLQQPEAAWAATETALAELGSRRDRPARMQVHALRALLALERDEPETAQAELDLAERQWRRDTPWQLRARAEEARGGLLLQRDEWAAAGAAFDQEALYYGHAGRFTDMARALARAAAAYQADGDDRAAVDRYYRAARHHYALNRPEPALRLIEQALPSLEACEDPELERRLARLFENLRAAVKQQVADDV